MRKYKIPGISAKLVDYQISADPITTPGDIVIILADLPDEITIPNPDKTGDFLSIPVPSNVPILINQTSELKSLLTGEDLKNGIINSVGKDQHLAIVNILPLLKTEKPVALCKIIRRNGERPDVTNNKELFEAMDYAYEHLGNYSAGSIVNAEIGYEDVIEKNIELISEITEYNSSLSNIKISSLVPKETVTFKKSYVSKDQLKFIVVDGSQEYTKTVTIPTKVDNLIYKKYLQLKTKAEEAKLQNSAVVLEDEFLPLLETETIETFLNSANAESGKIVNSNLIPTSFDITTPDNTYTFTINPVSLNFNDIRDDEVFGYENKVEIIPASFVLNDDSTYAFSNVVTPLDSSDVSKKITAVEKNYTEQNVTYSKKGLLKVEFDRTHVTVEQLDLNTDIRIKDKVLIDIDKTTNKFTNSVLLTIEEIKENKIVINQEEFEISGLELEANKVKSDFVFDYKGLVKIKLLKDLDLNLTKYNYEITILPLGAAFDTRTVQFCHQLTTDLNECIAYFGTKPPRTTNAKDIEEQVTKLYNLSKSKNYADTDLDKGLYLRVTTGAHKSGSYGGITNFPQTIVRSVTDNKVFIDNSLLLNIGDKLEISTVVKGKTLIQEFVVENLVETLDGVEVQLNKSVETKIVSSKNTKLLALTNKKDRKGTYLAAMYACFANSYDIDKAPMNAVLPGESEVFYTNTQLEKLLDARITPVNRKPFNTNGVIIDTPTLAMDTSDFSDQGTVGICFWLIRQLRNICEPKKGQRFGDAAKQILLQEELESPFKTILGTKILDYKLELNFAKLNQTNELDIAFSIREAKKLKMVKITARMF